MVVLDNSIFRFKGSELLVMLYLLTHANEMGVCDTSYSLLAHDLDLSVQNCRTIINRLKTLNEINTTSTNKITQVTILNYASYTLNANSHQQAKIDELTAKIAELEMQIEKGKKRKKNETPPMSAEDTKAKMKERALAFYNSLVPYVDSRGGKYPKEMIRAFYDYWTEPNKSNTKMKFEMQKTWEVGRRLVTWSNNNKVFKNNQNNTYGRETATDKLRRTFEEANEFRNRLAAEREANLAAGDID